MSTTRLGARDPRLADPVWLARTLEQHGEMWIALEVGVDRKTIRRRLVTLGICARVPGRRRGVTTITTTTAPNLTAAIDATAVAFLARYQSESRPSGPAATEDLLILRIRAAHDAKAAGDDLAYDDALLAIAAAAALVHNHRQKLRRTA